jgi:hypothetical protein
LPSNLESRKVFRRDYEAHLDSINVTSPQSLPEITENRLRIYEGSFPTSLSQNFEVSNSIQLDNNAFYKYQANHQIPRDVGPIAFRQGHGAGIFHGFGSQVDSSKCRDPSLEHRIIVPAQYLYHDSNQNPSKKLPIEHEIARRKSQGNGSPANGCHWNRVGIDSEQHALNSQTRGHISNAAARHRLSNSGILSGLGSRVSGNGKDGFAHQLQVDSYQPRNINDPSQELDRKMAVSSFAEYGVFGNRAEQGFDSLAYDLDFNNVSTRSGLDQSHQSAVTQELFLNFSQSMSQKNFLRSANQRHNATSVGYQHDDMPSDSNTIFPPLSVVRDRQSTEANIDQLGQNLPLQAIVLTPANSELLLQDWHDAFVTLLPNSSDDAKSLALSTLVSAPVDSEFHASADKTVSHKPTDTPLLPLATHGANAQTFASRISFHPP